MSQQRSIIASQPVQQQKDAALLATWRRFLDYDQVSSKQKRQYAQLREIVIALSLLTSAGAVFSIYIEQAATIPWLRFPDLQFGLGIIGETLRILLIIMPIASVTLMRYASQFASSTSWIEYRVGAETLRSEIYLYRMRAGEYKNLSDVEARSKLLDEIEETNARIDEQGATVPYMENYENIESLISSKTDSPALDDGLQELSVDDYIDWRVRRQLSWYIDKIQRDYSTLQREQRLALAVGAFGAVLAGFGENYVALVAVTTAMGSALTARSETRMYGATYGIFHWTAGRLQHELNQWEILPEEEKKDQENQTHLVEEIEKIFKQERELWRAQAMQSQNNSDNAINSQLQQRVDREDFEASQKSGIVPIGIPDAEIEDEFVNYSTTQSMRVMKPDDVKQLSEALAVQNQLGDGTATGTDTLPDNTSPSDVEAPIPEVDPDVELDDEGVIPVDESNPIAEPSAPADGDEITEDMDKDAAG